MSCVSSPLLFRDIHIVVIITYKIHNYVDSNFDTFPWILELKDPCVSVHYNNNASNYPYIMNQKFNLIKTNYVASCKMG